MLSFIICIIVILKLIMTFEGLFEEMTSVVRHITSRDMKTFLKKDFFEFKVT